MVDALEIARRLLLPGGLVINIQPIGRARPLEIHGPAGIESAGTVSHRLNHANQVKARVAVQRVLERGLFRLEKQATVPFLSHFDSPTHVDDWLKETSTRSYLEPATLERALALAQAAGDHSETIMRETLLMSLLRPLELAR